MNAIDLLTRKDVAAMLKITVRHLCNLEKAGLPSYRLGGAVRYRESEVAAFLQSHRTLRMTLVRRRMACPTVQSSETPAAGE